jgi:hypothetical protein
MSRNLSYPEIISGKPLMKKDLRLFWRIED